MPNRIVDMGSWIRYTIFPISMGCRLYHHPVKDRSQACYLGRKVKGPARSLPNQSRAVRNPCTRRSSRRSSSVAQSLHVGSASITDQTHGIALFLRRRVSPRAHCACVFQLRTFGFHRCKPDFLSSAIAREGAYLLVKPVIPGVAFIR